MDTRRWEFLTQIGNQSAQESVQNHESEPSDDGENDRVGNDREV